ncbi:MAG TPA: Bax inhibitor-1 family protein [Blastocatellia bacterium]|nr:Bax inhibitor-1 family protein [Blastocatellia bacterium]
MQQASYYPNDQFTSQIISLRGFLIGVAALLILLFIGLRLMPEESTPLMAKVTSLLCPTLFAAAFGAYAGRNLRGWLPFIGIFIGVFVGMLVISALGGSLLASLLLLPWGFVAGMMLGPLVSMAIEMEGPMIVFEALTGTTAVMMLTALIVFATGINFSFLMPLLFLGLMGLIVVGLIGIFVRFSRTVNIVYSIIGLALFAGYFLFDFFRATKSSNTWENATSLTIELYLDFANFFAFLLRLLLATRRR